MYASRTFFLFLLYCRQRCVIITSLLASIIVEHSSHNAYVEFIQFSTKYFFLTDGFDLWRVSRFLEHRQNDFASVLWSYSSALLLRLASVLNSVQQVSLRINSLEKLLQRSHLSFLHFNPSINSLPRINDAQHPWCQINFLSKLNDRNSAIWKLCDLILYSNKPLSERKR